MGNSDSRASFVEGINKLLGDEVPADDDSFWSQLFQSQMMVEDVFEIIGPDHVRQLKRKKPKNLQAFLRHTMKTAEKVVNTSDKTGTLTPQSIVAATNAVRLLTRIVPFSLEEPDDEICEAILWRQGGYVEGEGAAADSSKGAADTAAPPPDGADAAGSEGAKLLSGEGGAGAAAETPSGPKVLAEEILHYLMRFLFLPDFTVSVPRNGGKQEKVSSLPTHRVDAKVVWRGGIGVSKEMPTIQTQAQFKARIEVLRCILCCLSGPLFQSADEYQEQPSKWLLHFTGGEVCHTANLFCSLMSTVFAYDPVGWGLPYGGYFASGTEEEMVDIALQVLCVLMDFDPGDEDLPGGEGGADGEAAPEKRPRNVYRYMLQNVAKDGEIDFIFQGLVRLLSTMHKSSSTYLPNSLRSVGFYQEALVLLWHLITLNGAFLKRLVTNLDSNQILLPVIYLLHQAQNSPHLVGLLHTTSFVLLVLSSEREFAVRLNEPYVSNIPLDVPIFKGCYGDLLILSLHKVISDSLTRPTNDALVEMLLTVVCNVSSYVKAFCLESCLKLISMVERCSRPAYIFRSAFTHHGLIFLIEMLNNVVQYQYEGNTMLVYSILRQHTIFKNLQNLELPDKYKNKSGKDQPEPSENTEGTEAWVPTEAWLAGWKSKMPLQALTCLVSSLAPQIENLCTSTEVTGQDEVISYLARTTMVGILPVPHPIVIRTYQPSNYTAMWFTSYMWGVIFTRSQGLPIYDWKKIRLVVINQ